MGANLASDDRGSVVRHSVTRNNTGESLVRLDAGFVLYDANLRGLSSQWGWYWAVSRDFFHSFFFFFLLLFFFSFLLLLLFLWSSLCFLLPATLGTPFQVTSSPNEYHPFFIMSSLSWPMLPQSQPFVVSIILHGEEYLPGRALSPPRGGGGPFFQIFYIFFHYFFSLFFIFLVWFFLHILRLHLLVFFISACWLLNTTAWMHCVNLLQSIWRYSNGRKWKDQYVAFDFFSFHFTIDDDDVLWVLTLLRNNM